MAFARVQILSGAEYTTTCSLFRDNYISGLHLVSHSFIEYLCFSISELESSRTKVDSPATRSLGRVAYPKNQLIQSARQRCIGCGEAMPKQPIQATQIPENKSNSSYKYTSVVLRSRSQDRKKYHELPNHLLSLNACLLGI